MFKLSRAVILSAALLIPAGTALADNASHKDWPKINGDLEDATSPTRMAS